jgi:hypothetical protein
VRKVSQRVKDIVLSRPQICARNAENDCQGRLTWEHAIIHAGRQLDEAWAIIILCEYHHAVNNFQDRGDLKKELNVYYALNQATDEELKKVSKAIDYIALKARLNKKYGL